jgi:23S rRNA (pseudouridine1915-N3)-methyltransferase
MKLVVAAVGRMKRGPEHDLAERYRERTAKSGRAVAISGVSITEIAESRNRRAWERMSEEATRLGAAIPANAVAVALDARGETLPSELFATRIRLWRDAGRPAIVFLIGGPDGLAADITGRADMRLSFGPATWPHQLVRIMLFEQLYRAIAILSGHPYHRD